MGLSRSTLGPEVLKGLLGPLAYIEFGTDICIDKDANVFYLQLASSQKDGPRRHLAAVIIALKVRNRGLGKWPTYALVLTKQIGRVASHGQTDGWVNLCRWFITYPTR